MKYLQLCIAVFTLTLVSCMEKREVSDLDPPEVPAEISIDVNNDGVSDFMTTSFTVMWTGYDGSETLNTWLRISTTRNDIEFLSKDDVYADDFSNAFFLTEGDSINKESTSETVWKSAWINYARKAGGNRTNFKFPEEWEFLIDEDVNKYIIGYKISEEEKVYLGWMKFSVNKKEGSLAVIDFSEPLLADRIVVE